MAVTGVERLTTTTFAGGRSFGAGGVYNLIRGVAHFAFASRERPLRAYLEVLRRLSR